MLFGKTRKWYLKIRVFPAPSPCSLEQNASSLRQWAPTVGQAGCHPLCSGCGSVLQGSPVSPLGLALFTQASLMKVKKQHCLNNSLRFL